MLVLFFYRVDKSRDDFILAGGLVVLCSELIPQAWVLGDDQTQSRAYPDVFRARAGCGEGISGGVCPLFPVVVAPEAVPVVPIFFGFVF